jgi:hypothetical protein
MSLSFAPYGQLALRGSLDGLVTGPAFGQFCDQRVARIVPGARNLRPLLDVAPPRLQRRHGPGGVRVIGLAERGQKSFGPA